MTVGAFECYGTFIFIMKDKLCYRALAGWLIVVQPVYAIIVNIIQNVTTGYKMDFIGGLTLILSSFVISYARPCKLTIATLSFSYHFMIFGILCIAHHLWVYESDQSTGTGTLEVTLIIVPVISHILVLTWAVYTLIHRIVQHCGYQFDSPFAVNHCFHRMCSGYQKIPGLPAWEIYVLYTHNYATCMYVHLRNYTYVIIMQLACTYSFSFALLPMVLYEYFVYLK